jgi:hypothetical protein
LRAFGPKVEEIMGDWRKLRNQELYILHSSPNLSDKVKENEMGRECSKSEEKRNAYRIFIGEPEGKRPLGRPRRRY